MSNPSKYHRRIHFFEPLNKTVSNFFLQIIFPFKSLIDKFLFILNHLIIFHFYLKKNIQKGSLKVLVTINYCQCLDLLDLLVIMFKSDIYRLTYSPFINKLYFQISKNYKNNLT